MIKNRFSLFIATFLIIGFFFLALPENGYSGLAMTPIGCCQLEGGGGCADAEDGIRCTAGAFFPDQICNDATGQCIQPAINTPIPTISEWGLIAMAGILGIVGFMVIRRRKVTA